MLELSEIKKNITWQEAMNYATTLGEGWRLPTKEELQIIQASPKAKEFATKRYLWSSSTYVFVTGFAWVVNFGYGYVDYDYKPFSYDARCVRGSFDDLVLWCFGDSLKKEETVMEKNCENCYFLGIDRYVCNDCIRQPRTSDHWAPNLPTKNKDLTWMEAKEAWDLGWEVVDQLGHIIRTFAADTCFTVQFITSVKYQLNGKRRKSNGSPRSS
jgi:hypothetical protein